MLIFLAIAFIFPFALGILMGFAYYRGIDLSVFPTAQMYYPAAGVMLAALITRKGDPLLPKRFFIAFIAGTALLAVWAVASVLAPGLLDWNITSQYGLMGISLICLVLLLTEKKQKRVAFGLKGGRWGATALIVLLYLALYFGRTVIAYAISGQMDIMLEIVKNPQTWMALVSLVLTYFLVFTAFFGEEYGWRYYLQPAMQKKFGMIPGLLLLGVVWGLWHLPINFFYYTSPSMGLISVVGQLVTCITLGAFFGWAYLMTDNIWVVVILHFANNNLVPIISGNYSSDVLQNQQVTWGSVLYSLIVNTLLFVWVLFTKYYKDRSNRLPTLDERADRTAQLAAEQATVPAPPQGQ